MTRFSKKGVLLFAVAMALCAFAVPSAASAASWGPVGLETTLDSGDFGFTSSTNTGTIVARCDSSQFTADVATADDLRITGAAFGVLCTAVVNGVNVCTTTPVGTRFPWRATVPTTSTIQIHGVSIDMTFENTPGNAACAAAGVAGKNLTVAGTLIRGRWLGNAAREIVFSDAEGLTLSGLANGNATSRFSLFSTANLQIS